MFGLNIKRRRIGGIRETQEMLDFCVAVHRIVLPDDRDDRDEGPEHACERTSKNALKCRFVIDLDTRQERRTAA